MLDSIPSYRAQADSATSFYIFKRPFEKLRCLCIFCPVKRRKKFIKVAILDVLPGKAQPLVYKLDNLLAAVELPGKIFKHGVLPGVLLQNQRIIEIEISEPGLHP